MVINVELPVSNICVTTISNAHIFAAFLNLLYFTVLNIPPCPLKHPLKFPGSDVEKYKMKKKIKGLVSEKNSKNKLALAAL